MGGIAGSMLLLCMICLISLTNANNAPVINEFYYNVCEDTPTGVEFTAFTIEASDSENDPLTYSLLGPNAGYFTVDKNTGRVSVRRALDRESVDIMTVDTIVSDGPNETPGELYIILLEANDNPPIFDKPSYDIEIPENTPVGTSLFKVQATDDDTSTAGVIQYSIDGVSPEAGTSLFSIVSTTGEVRLSGSLNYTSLSPFYQLKINATDGGGQCYYNKTDFFSRITFSFITVEDVSDLDPKFFSSLYSGNVEEHCPLNQSVLQVTAIDQDTGFNDDIIYSIEYSSAADLFTIASDSGIIYVTSDIDRESVGDIVNITVKATESQMNIHGVYASATTLVQISITDINDNEPEFFECEGTGDELSCIPTSHFTGEVKEHSVRPISIKMMVKDLDKGAQTKLILEGADSKVFSVEPQLTMSDRLVQLLVKQPQDLDFEETQQMVLQVIAIDDKETSFRATATVTIIINDTNDVSPKFPQPTYKLNVTEHSPVGTIIANITAEDPDTMDQGKISYELLPESILLYFGVELHTGSIYVKNQTLLDREVRSLYSATLQARDTEDKVGTTVLEITLTDINDQPPVINRNSYQVTVEEGEQFEVTIEATDADEFNTANSQIVYGIEPSRYSDNFTINPNSGVLTNRGELDLEALDPNLDGKIMLNVTATDKGSPPLSATVPVFITIQDVNDNKPEFNASSYTFSVKEGEKGARVGSVYAEDLDQTANMNRISFTIINGSIGSFIILTYAEERGYRGGISVDPDVELDYESTHKKYALLVEAADLGQNKAVVTVEVNVVDVNDERPVFWPTEPVKVKENTTITETVGNFTAYDKDGNHSLVYELESITCRCNGSYTPCNSFILEPNGEVRVNPEITLDYEQCDQAVIEAQVVDVFTEKGDNNSITAGQMVINIEDTNDNAPEFIYSDSVFVVVSESANKGTSVAEVTATDLDSGEFREIDFKVTAAEFKDTSNHTSGMKNLFEAVTTQQKDVYIGIIQTTKGLDMTLKGKYLVTVSATDTGGLSTSTVLEIFTIDETYQVELIFKSSEAEVEEKLDEIVRALTAATQATVEILTINPDTSRESRVSPKTIVVAYFIYPNGTALTSAEVERKLSEPEHYLVLAQLGLMNIGDATVIGPEPDIVRYVLLGMMAGLIILLAVLTTTLMCTRRNYKRKLKAAKAMNSASMVTSDKQKGGPVVPGTNKYMMEGANPVLNLNIDTTISLDVDEGSSDVDKVSLNSLDCNDHMTIPEKGTKSGSWTMQEEDDLPEYIEPLGAALAQRGQNKVNPIMGYNNPAFSTTDL